MDRYKPWYQRWFGIEPPLPWVILLWPFLWVYTTIADAIDNRRQPPSPVVKGTDIRPDETPNYQAEEANMDKEVRALQSIGTLRDKLVVFNGVRAVAFDPNLSPSEVVVRVREYYEAFDDGDPKL